MVGRGGASVTGLCLVTIQPSKETERNEQHKTSKTHAYPQVTYKIYCFLRTLNLQLSLTPPNTSLIILTVLHSSWDTYIGRWTRNLEIRTLNKPTLYIWMLLLSHLSPNLHSNKPFSLSYYSIYENLMLMEAVARGSIRSVRGMECRETGTEVLGV